MRYMLDTNICSYLVKGYPPGPRQRLDAVGLPCVAISAIVRAELLAGLQGMDSATRSSRGTHQLLSAITTLPWSNEAADSFAVIWHETRRTGQRLEDMDLLIAAHAISINAILVTNNTRHFERLAPMLTIENWVEGA